MKVTETIQKLLPWAARMQALEVQLDRLRDLTGAMPDCDLMEPIYMMQDAYTAAVSEQVGDGNEWLSWFTHECKMGIKPMEVKFTGKPMKVRTLRQLAIVICKTRD